MPSLDMLCEAIPLATDNDESAVQQKADSLTELKFAIRGYGYGYGY